MREIFEAGWSNDASSGGGENFNHTIFLLKTITNIVQVSFRQRVRCRPPTVRFLLQNIRNGASKSILELLDKTRRTGAIIQTAGDFSSSSTPLPISPDMLDRMTANRSRTFSWILNLDRHIVEAAVSNISNREVMPQESHHPKMADVIKNEARNKVVFSFAVLTQSGTSHNP